jgi:hypothetical protein
MRTRSREEEHIMRRSRHLRFWILIALVPFFAGTSPAQDNPDKPTKALVLNGKTAASGVVQINGHSYVDVETVAQMTNGVVSVEPNRVVLTIPVPPPAPPAAALPPPPPSGLSKDFASASVAVLAEMREWRGAIGTMITYGLVVSDAWTHDYHDRVEASLGQAAVAATTDSDQNALPLLQNEFDKLTAWSNDVLKARQTLNGAKTVDPDALKNDPALASITACSRFLNGMIVSGTFSDSPSCH